MNRLVHRATAVVLALLPAAAFGVHPQTVWNAARLSALQAGNPSDATNVAIRNSLSAAVSAWDTGNVDPDVAEDLKRRAGDPAAVSLSARLKELQLPQGRLKTGTPPRIDGRTIDYSKLEEQPGDLDPIPVFSFLGRVEQHPRQVPCWVTHTNQRTHDIIRAGLDRSPTYTGVIEGVGPRYCPSIEDKVVRFADRAICIGPAKSAKSYLDIPSVISAADPMRTLGIRCP